MPMQVQEWLRPRATLRAVVLGGTSAAVIAYGQTGSGKTYQMQARRNSATLPCLRKCFRVILQAHALWLHSLLVRSCHLFCVVNT